MPLPARSDREGILKEFRVLNDVLMFKKWSLVALVVDELKDVS